MVEKTKQMGVKKNSDDSTEGDKQIEKEEPLTETEADEDVTHAEDMAQSSSDTESEPTVILPKSTEAQVEMEEIDLASEIVKEVEERISKSEIEANNLKEVEADKLSENEESPEPAIEKESTDKIAKEGEAIVQEVLAIVKNDEEAPENTPEKPLRSKKSSTSSDNEEAPTAALEQKAATNVKDELATPEPIDDKLSDVRKIKKNNSRRKQDMVTCKCC